MKMDFNPFSSVIPAFYGMHSIFTVSTCGIVSSGEGGRREKQTKPGTQKHENESGSKGERLRPASA